MEGAETKFRVKPLPHARIPIIKLTLDPSQSLPFGIACDIGFENRLALENTRLLLSYATVDPSRVRPMVLFCERDMVIPAFELTVTPAVKVWTKRRKINSPYQGTLSSYGYVLLVLYFLIHVKNPAVLPNLQAMPPVRPVTYVSYRMQYRGEKGLIDMNRLNCVCMTTIYGEHCRHSPMMSETSS